MHRIHQAAQSKLRRRSHHGINRSEPDLGLSGRDAESAITAKAKRLTVITALADLPAKALMDETGLADALGVTKRTVRRMVARFELPPSVPFAGRSTWIVERVLRHIEVRAERAARIAEQEQRRIESIGFKALEKSLEGIKELEPSR